MKRKCKITKYWVSYFWTLIIKIECIWHRSYYEIRIFSVLLKCAKGNLALGSNIKGGLIFIEVKIRMRKLIRSLWRKWICIFKVTWLDYFTTKILKSSNQKPNPEALQHLTQNYPLLRNTKTTFLETMYETAMINSSLINLSLIKYPQTEVRISHSGPYYLQNLNYGKNPRKLIV